MLVLELVPLAAAAFDGVQAVVDQIGQALGGGLAEDDPAFVRGWDRMTEIALVVRVIVDVAVALVLASVIAFHPRRRGRAVDVAEVNYPKTVLLYAVMGTIVAEIVVVSPAMALVVFGIGGLVRFRTDVGAPHDTGHVILATLVGIAAGLGRYPLAVVATTVAWLLIAALERGVIYRLVVESVPRREIEASVMLYQEFLESEGWSIEGIKREPGKQRFSIWVRGRAAPPATPVEDRVSSSNPVLLGEPYWEEE